MSKVKSSTKAAKPTKSDVLTKVKSGGVAKPAKEDKVAKKELAKKAEKEEKKSKKDKKKAKEPTPEPDSDAVSSESESSDSESEAETKKAATNGKASKKAAAKEDSSDDSDSSSEDEAPAPKKADAKTNGAKVAAKKDESDSDSSDSSDDEEEAAPKVNKAAAKDDSDDSESSDDDDEAKPKVNGSALPADAADDETDSDASDSDSSSEDDEEKPAKTNKRKAEDDAEPTTKKAKTEVTTTATGEESTQKNLFVGNLSWNIDEAWLRETFEEHGELSGCRVMTDKATGRSKGFGYVEFVKAEDAAAAYEAKKGFELDNREINLDWASAKPNNQDSQNDRRKQYGDQLSEPTDTLFVGNLSFDVGQEQVSEAFASHGTILSVRLPTQPDTGLPKGFGYVTFSTVEEATGALESMQGSYLSNRPVRLDYSQPRPPRDDNGGGRGRGGFGGRGGGRGRGGFGDRGGRGGGRGFGDRGGRGGRGGSFGGRGRGASTNRGGFGDFQGQKKSFD